MVAGVSGTVNIIDDTDGRGWDIGHGNYDYCAESDLCPYRHQSAQFALEIFLLVQIDMKGCQ